MTNLSSKNIFQVLCFILSSQTLLSCGPSATNSSSIASTDERPDVSEDRTSVRITAGTRNSATIRAEDLSALVTGVPDLDSDSTSTMKLTGSFIFSVTQNPRTNMVAIGVRSFIYAETDFSMVFVVNPAFPNKPQLVSFDAPGRKALPNGTTHPLRSIKGMSYDSAGVLHIKHADASGSFAEVLVNPDLSIRSCHYVEKSEGSLCGESF
jgi:hypothetical protein